MPSIGSGRIRTIGSPAVVRPTMEWASLPPLIRIVFCLRIDVSPEGGNILRQIAKDQVRAVAAKVSFSWFVFRQWKDALGIVSLLDQRPIGVTRVLVGIAEQEFSERCDIGVVERIAQALRLVAFPIENWLAYAVLEAERLIRTVVVRGEDSEFSERCRPGLPFDLDFPARQPLRSWRRAAPSYAALRQPVPTASGLGSFGPTSPSRRERLSSPAIPTMNSSENPRRISSERPSAFNPSYVKAT